MLSLPYAFKSLFRNKKRTLQNAFGIFLAVTIISAVVFYNETAAIKFLNDALDDIEVDMTVSSFDLSAFSFGVELPEVTYNITEIDIWLENQSLVSASEYFISLSEKIQVKAKSDSEISTGFIGIESSYLDTFHVFNISEGIFNDSISKNMQIFPILIDERNALKLGLSVNDTVNVTKTGPDFLNMTGSLKNYTQICRIAGIYQIRDTSSFLGLSMFNKEVGMIILPIWNLLDWRDTLFQRWGALQGYDYKEQLHIKFNHSVLPSNPDAAGGKTTAFSNKVLVKFGGQVYAQDNIGLSVLILRIVMLIFQMFLLFLSLPAIILALYLQKYSVETSMEMRSIEITTLQSRGASSGQVLRMILSEVLVIALIATSLGIICGELVSQVMLWTPQFLTIDPLLIDFDFTFSSMNITNVSLLAIISIVLALISAYLPARRLIKDQDFLEGMKEERSQKASLWKRVYLDVVFTMLGLLLLALQIGFDFDIESGGLLFAILAAVTPSLFWLGSILLIARIGSHLILKTENILIQGFTVIFSLGEVVAKSVTRRPESLSKAIIILALTFSFGIMVSTTAHTDHLTNVSQAQFASGADVQVKSILPLSITELDNSIQSIDSNAITSAVYKDNIIFGGTQVPILGVDNNFYKVAFLRDQFFVDSRIEEVFSNLLIQNNCIISNDFALDFDYDIASSLADSGLIVSDIAYNFPTIGSQILYGIGLTVSTGTSSSGNYFIVTSSDTFETFFGSRNASFFLINTQIDPLELQAQLIDVYGKSLDITTSSEILSTIEEPGIANFNGVLSIEFVVVIIIACIGSGIFLLTAIQKRKREVGTLIALGATNNQVGTFIIGEAITAGTFSILAGTIIGLIVTILFRGFRAEPGSIASPVIFSVTGFGILLGCVVLGIIIAVIISLWEIKKTSVSEVLRTI
ncbi:MAG: ABC transporter permease [Promethearchaeota archaeon]